MVGEVRTRAGALDQQMRSTPAGGGVDQISEADDLVVALTQRASSEWG